MPRPFFLFSFPCPFHLSLYKVSVLRSLYCGFHRMGTFKQNLRNIFVASAMAEDCGYYKLQNIVKLWMALDSECWFFLLSSLFQLTPIFLLPKLEYQAYYGVEVLTESEVCQLWTQSMLHSECLFYIGKFMCWVFA